MAKSKRKLSNKEQFQREQLRITKAVERLREQGYNIDVNVIPKAPKRVTQQKLKEIKSIKPKKLKELAYTYDEQGNKISYNEYQQWLEAQPQNEYPTIDIMDRITERIEERVDVSVLYRLESEIQNNIDDPKRLLHHRGESSKGVFYLPTTYRKSQLIEAMEDSYLAYGNEYIDYLMKNEVEISDEIDKINYVTYEEVLKSSFVNLAIKLKMGMSLTPTESISYDKMSEEL